MEIVCFDDITYMGANVRILLFVDNNSINLLFRTDKKEILAWHSEEFSMQKGIITDEFKAFILRRVADMFEYGLKYVQVTANLIKFKGVI